MSSLACRDKSAVAAFLQRMQGSVMMTTQEVQTFRFEEEDFFECDQQDAVCLLALLVQLRIAVTRVLLPRVQMPADRPALASQQRETTRNDDNRIGENSATIQRAIDVRKSIAEDSGFDVAVVVVKRLARQQQPVEQGGNRVLSGRILFVARK